MAHTSVLLAFESIGSARILFLRQMLKINVETDSRAFVAHTSALLACERWKGHSVLKTKAEVQC